MIIVNPRLKKYLGIKFPAFPAPVGRVYLFVFFIVTAILYIEVVNHLSISFFHLFKRISVVNIPIKPTGVLIEIAQSTKLFLTLKVGQIIGGKVIRPTMDSLATLLINNKNVEVRTDIEMNKGDNLLLKVVKNDAKSGEIRLNIVEPPKAGQAKAAKAASAEFIKSSGAGKLVSSEINTFKSFVSKLDSSVLAKIPTLKAIDAFLLPIEEVDAGAGEGLKRAIKTSGLFLEANLKEAIVKAQSAGAAPGAGSVKKEALTALIKEINRDFKGSLIKLRAALKETETIEILKQGNIKPEELGLRVDKLIKNIEFFQIQSKFNDVLELFVPFFWKSLRDGELTFSETYKGASATKSYSCTINLDLESSGRVSAIVLLIFESVHISFIAEKKEFIALINENSGALKSTFKKLGLTLGSIRASREEKLDFKTLVHKPFEEGFNVKA